MVDATTRSTLALTFLLAATPATLSAQDAVPLDGFWIGGGVPVTRVGDLPSERLVQLGQPGGT